MRFVDANIIIRFLTRDDAYRSSGLSVLIHGQAAPRTRA